MPAPAAYPILRLGPFLNLLSIVQSAPQPCLEALLSRYLEWASFLSLIERSSGGAILRPQSGLSERSAAGLVYRPGGHSKSRSRLYCRDCNRRPIALELSDALIRDTQATNVVPLSLNG